MKQTVHRIYKPTKKLFISIKDNATASHYYKYARKNIECQCPLCKCPSQGAMKYSFVYICEERKIIYYDIPKCASTTIREEIFNNNNKLSMSNPSLELNKYFKFSFVRNPWDRMVSNWKMFTNKPYRIKQLKSMTSKDVSKFKNFIRFARERKNHHWQPQYLFLPDKLDYLGKVENFREDFSYVLSMIGENPREVKKHNTTKRDSYWNYYTPELERWLLTCMLRILKSMTIHLNEISSLLPIKISIDIKHEKQLGYLRTRK